MMHGEEVLKLELRKTPSHLDRSKNDARQVLPGIYLGGCQIKRGVPNASVTRKMLITGGPHASSRCDCAMHVGLW
jgi:hypothetical protein